MSVQEQTLWKHLEEKAKQEAPGDCHSYMAEVEKICKFAVGRASMINLTFPMYTLHNETHICNVLRIMADLLGDSLDKLTRDETAMLILAACCHDVGMSVKKEEREALLEGEQFDRYLETCSAEYARAFEKGDKSDSAYQAMERDFLRSIHHEWAADLLSALDWPMELVGKVDRDDLIRVCQSHGQALSALADQPELYFPAVLLRLGDILDFDTSRAPKAIYDYCGFDGRHDPESEKSRDEWKKHMDSAGFNFSKVESRKYPYDLPYAAKCYSMQQERAIRSYLDWVDRELTDCGKTLRRYAGKWNQFVLPDRVQPKITAVNYVSGEYRLTMDQSQVLNLLVGESLYSDPAVFVRELIQNAIDAVRTRERLDNNLPRDWKGQINIRTWMDEKGYHWFRIEDNGTGMDEEIIRKHLLTVGSSYYQSEQFRREKQRRGAEDYTPISRFGIGLLSCFMGDRENNRVEISTKRYQTGDSRPPALRLSMEGLSGYYYMANKDKHHHPDPMIGQTKQERKPFLTQPGTVVAVRTNLYQSGGYRGFREIVDKYVVYPPVPIHYEGPEGAVDYTTEDEFMERVHQAADLSDQAREGEFVFHLNKKQLDYFRRNYPEAVIEEMPGIQLKCVALDRYTESPYLKGMMVLAKSVGRIPSVMRTIEGEQVQVDFPMSMEVWTDNTLSLNVSGRDSFFLFLPDTLSELSWYRNLFPTSEEQNRETSAHNGVFCGSTRGIFRSASDAIRTAVLLLGDYYRPVLGLERDGIRQLPLEALADLALVRQQLKQEGYDIGISFTDLDMIDCAKLSAKKYLELLEKRPDFEKRLLIPTEERGTLTGADFLQAVKEQPSLTLSMRWWDSMLTTRKAGGILNSLRLAWLQSRCCLRIRLEREEFSAILAYPGQPAPEESRWKDFPPAFFLPPESEGCPYLAKSDSNSRFACNVSHPLSRFLMDNVDKLKEHTPGVFWDILNSLAEDNARDIITLVNDRLDFLRNMPGSPVSVPAGLKLTEKDFC